MYSGVGITNSICKTAIYIYWVISETITLHSSYVNYPINLHSCVFVWSTVADIIYY
jgi:hypothetical protein